MNPGPGLGCRSAAAAAADRDRGRLPSRLGPSYAIVQISESHPSLLPPEVGTTGNFKLNTLRPGLRLADSSKSIVLPPGPGPDQPGHAIVRISESRLGVTE